MAAIAVIDHIDHDLTTVLHTVAPENLHWVERVSAVQDIDYELSLKANVYDGTTGVRYGSVEGTLGRDFIGPYRTNFRLRLTSYTGASGFPTITPGGTTRLAGLHTSVAGAFGSNKISIAGKDWLHYFEKRVFPFDGRNAHIYDNVIGTPPQGLSFQIASGAGASARPEQIAKTVIDHVLAVANSLPLNSVGAYPGSNTGTSIDYQLSLADTTTLFSIVQGLSQLQTPASMTGFDFKISPGRDFYWFVPQAYGDPSGLVASGSAVGITDFMTNQAVAYYDQTSHFGSYRNLYDANGSSLVFANNGPLGTHVKAFGAGLTNSLATTIGYLAGESTFWRLDDIQQLGNITAQGMLDDLAQGRLSYILNPQHDVTLVTDVNDANIDLFAGNGIKPGMAIYIKADLDWHLIDAPFQIVSMEFTQSQAGNIQCALGLNQIYDIGDPTFVGNPEG